MSHIKPKHPAASTVPSPKAIATPMATPSAPSGHPTGAIISAHPVDIAPPLPSLPGDVRLAVPGEKRADVPAPGHVPSIPTLDSFKASEPR